MLDVGFSEILVIFVLALVVLGPEKLPRVASQVGRWIGRARGMARQFREQLEEEVTLEQARKSQPPVVPRSSPVEPPQTPQIVTEAPPQAPPLPPAQTEAEQLNYPDTYSHAHPTDAQGRPVEAAVTPVHDSRQQDWVEGLSGAANPSQSGAQAAYAPPDERGT